MGELIAHAVRQLPHLCIAKLAPDFDEQIDQRADLTVGAALGDQVEAENAGEGDKFATGEFDVRL